MQKQNWYNIMQYKYYNLYNNIYIYIFIINQRSILLINYLYWRYRPILFCFHSDFYFLNYAVFLLCLYINFSFSLLAIFESIIIYNSDNFGVAIKHLRDILVSKYFVTETNLVE